MDCKSATQFLDGLIQKESCLIERLFIQHKMPEKQTTLTILKINAYRFFQFSEVTCGDKVSWSKNIWYSKDLLGGWIYELRREGIEDEDIYDCMFNSRENFFTAERGKYSNNKIYDAMIQGLKEKFESL